MTSVDPSLKSTALEASEQPAIPWWARAERVVESLSEYLNPILVKEARQALKSKQFAITFTLLLVLGWGWSLLGVSLVSPAIYYAAMGPFMLAGYYVVMAIPLLVVVPFAAFRSLAAEREDGTYELLSITTLSSRQVVTGKLGSAILQMLVYYSALSPCIAFTYLLRGIDILSIIMVLALSFFLSLILSALGMLVATITQARHWQILLSVVLIVALAIVAFFWSIFILQVISQGGTIPYDEVEFWIGVATALSFYASFIVLMVAAASSQLSFASNNRSTPLRVIMLGQQALLIGWFLYYWTAFDEEGWLIALPAVAAVLWAVYGALLIGERAQLSPRVRRQLPQTVLGRVLLTWFNPGSGTGYVFVVANLGTVVLITLMAGFWSQVLGVEEAPDDPRWAQLALVVFFYVCIYLGAARLAFLLARQLAPVGMLFSFLITLFTVIAGAALPPIIQSLMVGFSNLDYSLAQLSNWAWTIVEIGENNTYPMELVTIILGAVAAAVLLLNVILAAREVEQVRAETPQRVRDDDAERQHKLPPRRRTSPWDDGELAAAEGA